MTNCVATRMVTESPSSNLHEHHRFLPIANINPFSRNVSSRALVYFSKLSNPRCAETLIPFKTSSDVGYESEITVDSLEKSLNTVNSACEEDWRTLEHKEIMKKILHLGNKTYHGTARVEVKYEIGYSPLISVKVSPLAIPQCPEGDHLPLQSNGSQNGMLEESKLDNVMVIRN